MRRRRSICGAAFAGRSNRPRRQARRPRRQARSVLLSSLAEVARDYIQLRGVQTDLQIDRDNVQHRAPKPEPDPGTGRRRRHHRPRCGERLGAVAHNAGADPDRGAAGSGADQRAEPAAGTAAQRAARRTCDGEAGAAGSAARAGRHSVGTGAPPSGHPPGGGAAACRDGRYRRGGGEFLSVAQPDRQPGPAIAAVQQFLQRECETICDRTWA